jgi:hypothetical protein
MLDQFLSGENLEYLTWRVQTQNEQGLFVADPKVLARDLAAYAADFARRVKLDTYRTVDDNWFTVLDYLNRKFINEYTREKRDASVSYPLELAITAGLVPDGNPMRTMLFGKPLEYLTVEDIRNVDLWNRDHRIYRSNANFRNRNNIRGWETRLNRRNYETDTTEALRDTRELETFQRGYDMTRIHDIARSYTGPGSGVPGTGPFVPALKRLPGYGESHYWDQSDWD